LEQGFVLDTLGKFVDADIDPAKSS